MELLTSPHPKFKSENHLDFVPFVYQLALLSMPVKDIAAKCRVHRQTLENYPPIMEAIREGHADHRATIELELFNDATAVPALFEVEERPAIRAARSAALKILKTAIDKRDDFTPQQEVERIKRLSDAELQEELKKFLEKK